MQLRTIVILEGDQTGQELLEESLRVLAADVTGLEIALPRFDLSLESRRSSGNEVVHDAAAAIREHGLGLKAATVTPEGRGDVGSPNRILREEIGGKVIVRTGRRIPGVAPLGRDRGGLHSESVLANRGGRLEHHAVVGGASGLEREVEARDVELDSDHLGLEDAEALLEELLSRLVALEDDDRQRIPHRGPL